MEENMQPVEKAKKKWSTGKIVGVIVAGVVLLFLIALCVGLVIVNKAAKAIEENPELVDQIVDQLNEDTEEAEETEETEETESTTVADEDSAVDITEIMKYGTFSYTDDKLADEYHDLIVAKVGEHEMNNGMFSIFYWTQFQSFMNEYGDYISYLGLDTTLPMSEQNYGEEVTWEQHFVEEALNVYRQYCALADDAKALGIELGEETQERLDGLADLMNQNIGTYGYESIDDYLASSFGPGVTFEDYKTYYELYLYAVTLAGEIEDSIDVDEEAIEAYFDENAESYADEGIEKSEQNMIDVRHILIEPVYDTDTDDDGELDTASDNAWAEAKAYAEEIYAKWKEDPTEDNFITMAGDYSTDTGSSTNGGLYEDVFPGEMVTEFNDWCFDASRQPGDTGIVQTDYGYHIMYFVETGDEAYWHSIAKSDCVEDQFYDALDEVFQRYPLTPTYDNLHIYDLLYVTALQQAASEESTEEAAE